MIGRQRIMFVVVALASLVMLLATYHSVDRQWTGRLKESEPFTCDEPEAELGTILRSASSDLAHDFRLTNTTPEPQRLRVQGRSCTCIDVSLSTENVRPGETVVVHTIWHVPPSPGPVSFRVVLSCDSAPDWEAELVARAEIADVLRVRPPILNIHELKPGEKRVRSIDILAPAGERIDDHVGLAEGDELDGLDVVDVERTEGRLRIHVSATGMGDGKRRLHALKLDTGRTEQPVIEIPIHVSHSHRFKAEPTALLLKQPKLGNRQTIEVEDTSGQPMQAAQADIVYFGSDDGVLTVDVTRRSPTGIELSVSVTQTLPAGKQSLGAVRITPGESLGSADIPFTILW